MALADKTLLVVGLPDRVDPKDPLSALEGSIRRYNSRKVRG
jgi:hypothetical protein